MLKLVHLQNLLGKITHTLASLIQLFSLREEKQRRALLRVERPIKPNNYIVRSEHCANVTFSLLFGQLLG